MHYQGQCYHLDRDGLTILNRWDEPMAQVTEAIAEQATKMLNRAASLNDARHYTASARMHRKAEALPGFTWSDPDLECDRRSNQPS